LTRMPVSPIVPPDPALPPAVTVEPPDPAEVPLPPAPALVPLVSPFAALSPALLVSPLWAPLPLVPPAPPDAAGATSSMPASARHPLLLQSASRPLMQSRRFIDRGARSRRAKLGRHCTAHR